MGSSIDLSNYFITKLKSHIDDSGKLKAEDISLTRRETETLKYIIMGYSNAEIAEILKISPRTIDDYAVSLKEKLNCTARGDIIRKSISTGIIFSYKDLWATK